MTSKVQKSIQKDFNLNINELGKIREVTSMMSVVSYREEDIKIVACGNYNKTIEAVVNGMLNSPDFAKIIETSFKLYKSEETTTE